MTLVTALERNKKALRKAMRATLKSLPASDVQAQSRLITAHLLASAAFRRSRAVSCFLSMPSGEVDTYGLVESILDAGKHLYVPKVVHPSVSTSAQPEMHMLRVYDQNDLYAIPIGTWGIREPDWDYKGKKRASALDANNPDLIDVILVPGVAFDPTLSRIGYGKGYYDRFISLCSARALREDKGRPVLVALALREQILPAGTVPMEEHDWKVDMIVGPDGIVSGDGHREEITAPGTTGPDNEKGS